MLYIKKNIYAIIIILALLSFGFLLFFIEPFTLIRIIMYMLAIFFIATAINFFIASREYVGNDKIMLLVQSVVLIIVSILIFFVGNEITRIIVGSIFIIYPFVKMLISNNKFQQFKKDIPKYLLGIILILSLNIILEIVLKAMGSALFLLGLFILIILIKNINNKDNPNIVFNFMIKYLSRKERKDKWEL